jgi:hypothetical protein
MKPHLLFFFSFCCLSYFSALAQESVFQFKLTGPIGDLVQSSVSPAFSPPKKQKLPNFDVIFSYFDSRGKKIEVPIVMQARGTSSLREEECSFPKFEMKFSSLPKVKVGTHCGEEPDDQRSPLGRLRNEKSPIRENFVYQLLTYFGLPMAHAHNAQITYADTSEFENLGTFTRRAFLFEDIDDAAKRFTAERVKTFNNAKADFSDEAVINAIFGEALIGNFDWKIRMTATDTFRNSDRESLSNIYVLRGRNNRLFPVVTDFDLSEMVAGPYVIGKSVFNSDFEKDSTRLGMLAQLGRLLSFYPRETLNKVREKFLSRLEGAYVLLANANELDLDGRAIVKKRLDDFFAIISDDALFYPNVITREGAYASKCDIPIPLGTPVRVIRTLGRQAEVALLDVHWRFFQTPCSHIAHRTIFLPIDFFQR